jgi:single-strand DNA-binding protein
MNKVILIGVLGKDPVAMGDKKAVVKFSMATEERYKDQSGEWKKTTTWHNVVCFQHAANTALKHLAKGSKVLIDGKIKTGNYEGKDGKKVYTFDVQAEKIEVLKSTKKEEEGTGFEGYGGVPGQQGAKEHWAEDDIPF